MKINGFSIENQWVFNKISLNINFGYAPRWAPALLLKVGLPTEARYWISASVTLTLGPTQVGKVSRGRV